MTRKHIKWILIALVLVIVGVSLLQIVGQSFIEEVVVEVIIEKPKQDGGVVIGERASHFELSDFIGRAVKLSQFLDTPVVLTFWTTWNSIAADQINIFDGYLSRNENSLFIIVTINNQEERGVVAQFMRRGGTR